MGDPRSFRLYLPFVGDPRSIPFGVTRRRFVCIFATGEDKGSAPSSRRRQRSSALH